MTHHLTEEDQMLVARFVDGELDAPARREFETRLADEPALRAAVDELTQTSSLFDAGRAEATPQPSEGFQDRVLREIRRLPTGQELATAGSGDVAHFEAFCRRLMVAAVLLIGLGVLVFAGILRQSDTGKLEASPQEVREEMERLDALTVELAPRENR